MKITLLLAMTASILTAAENRENFDAAGTLPKGWKTGITGKGEARWEVVKEPSAPSAPNVLKQSGEATFCWAAKTDEKIKDGFVAVSSKPVSGKEDQAAGLVWRFQDANNYYIVRSNALEGNVVLYKTVGGKRSSLQVKGRTFGYGVDAKIPANVWSKLRVDFSGKLFTVSFDGKKLFEVEDETFPSAGAVGLWTKADSVTLFDDFTWGDN
jgi:hypothetical protein